MSTRLMLSLFAACALLAVRPAFSQPATDKSSKTEPQRASAWTTVSIPEGSLPRGKLMFARYCLACHGVAAPTPIAGPQGPGGPGPGGPMGGGPMVPPGTAELEVKYGNKEMADLEKRSNLAPETIIYFVRRGIGVMPAIRKTELSDADLQSIAEYLAPRR